MNDPVKLIGLDFGTTTSSAVIAAARIARNSVTGRMELSQVEECHRPAIVFTPFQDENLDEHKINDYLDAWLAAGAVQPEEVFGGGALLTGLAAQAGNAAALVRLVRGRLGEALIARAEDPCLESWLAFMGACADLSRAHPRTPIVNLDVGGGTTNLALGLGGEVLRTGCLFVGARHVRVEPGGYRLVRLSPYARPLFDHLGIAKGPGDWLSPEEVDAVLSFYLDLLGAALTGEAEKFQPPVARLHEQVPFRMPAELTRFAVTLSGGVGELVYAHLRGKPLPPTTHYGDLGIDLARRILEAPWWTGQGAAFIPAGAGRATVYGLLRHTTLISGSTLFLPRPETLPLRDLPLFGRITEASDEEHLHHLLDLVRRSPRGGGIQVTLGRPGPEVVREVGARLARVLRAKDFPPAHPVVLFVAENLGKVLGQYATAWGALPLNLVVIDELAARDAQFAQVGSFQNQVVPVSFYGMTPGGESP